MMEKHPPEFLLLFIVLVSLAIISFLSCVVAEFKKPKRKDLRWDGKLCYLEGSEAFGFGIAAMICLSIAQIIGNIIICKSYLSRDKTARCSLKLQAISTALLLSSWMSFGVCMLLLSTSTSMSRRQSYEEGWAQGECYIVKNGIFVASGCLVVLGVMALLGTASGIMVNDSRLQHIPK